MEECNTMSFVGLTRRSVFVGRVSTDANMSFVTRHVAWPPWSAQSTAPAAAAEQRPNDRPLAPRSAQLALLV